MNKNLKAKIGKGLFYLVIFIIAFYMLFPFYWAFNSSLKTEAQLQMTPATIVPLDPDTGGFAPTLINYKSVFGDSQFTRGIMNSTIVAVCTTALALTVGSFAAFAMGKLRFKGKKPVLYVILAMTMFPQVTILSGLYAIITKFQLNAYLSMILTYMIFTLPFTVWVLTSFFKELPREIMESAQVDGCTPYQTFRLILLPLTMPALVTTGLLAFMAAWNEYLFALTFTAIDKGARTVPVAISFFTGNVSRQEPFGEIMAATIVVTVPIVILVLIFQRKIIAGLTAGSVKG